MKSRLWAVVALLCLLLAGCGGAMESQPDPVSYVLTGIDLVPDQLTGQPDMGVVPQDPSNPRDNSVVILERPLYVVCNRTSEYQYTTATAAGVGVGTKHYKISGQPANVSINEQSGLVSTKPDADCVPGGYTLTQYIDAESNGKIATSNRMLVRVVMQ